ncbi:MAG: TlpA family protein disulfide reductase [Prevotellaceae bacterium]|jgi:thiol-disulfide isomerase/thioredoxin|nr:TlpA family protein disulfide reductase [Prevotellaceae bacterium]
MKKIVFLSLLILWAMASAFAQKTSTVSGKWQRAKTGEVKLFAVENGSLNEIASSKPAGNEGVFSLSFSLSKEGYYVVGLSAATALNRYIFYFKPGDALNLNILEKSYELVGENTPENKEIARWHDFVFPLEDKAVYFQGKNSTYVDFFPLFEDKLKELEQYTVVATPNQAFNSSFEDFKKNDLLCIALTFVQTPRSAHPKAIDFIDYYKKIDLAKLTENTSILNYPGGMNLLLQAYMTVVQLDGTLNDEGKKAKYTDPVANLLGSSNSVLITNDTVKGELALMMARNNRSAASFAEYEAKFAKFALTADQKERWEKVKSSLNQNTARKDAVDFKFVDVSGKQVSLSDFKGKVVYIDVWATWCGPCRREFPAMKKLEEEYRDNKDMVFMGVNTDVSKNKQKWLDFLKKEQLPGVQIFAGDAANEVLMKPYQIGGIPRFILVGKDGKLIFANAPRPTSGEIKAILNSALKE